MAERVRGRRLQLGAKLRFRFETRILGRKLWWQCFLTPVNIHVLPYGDTMMHDSDTCICGPIVQLRDGWQGDEWWTFHRALDGRPQMGLTE